MDSMLPALPTLALLAALLSRRGAIVSAVVGIVATLAIIFFSRRYALDFDAVVATDLTVVLILTLSVALVIVPGQILNALLQTTGTIKKIGARVHTINLPPVKMASVIVLGVAPALESLTGFGVSLFFTVPVLAQLFPLRVALLLSLLGMNIMPWGTLALATLVGAQIAGVDFAALSAATAVTSFAVFPVIGVLIFTVCRNRGDGYANLPYPLLTGAVLSCSLVFYNTVAAAELAGVCAGLTTAALMLLFEWARARGLLAAFNRARPSLLKLFAPYLLLIALIGLSRIHFIHDALQSFLVLENSGVKLFVFTSPGVFIFTAVLILFSASKSYRRHRQVFLDGVKRAVYPVAGIMLFVVFAQLHRASSIFTDIAAKMLNLNLTEIAFIAPLLGMFSGYATGSNVGGNALFMSLQSETGGHFGEQLLFAALQNSAAGHAVFISLPIILLALSIAATDDDARAEQSYLARRMLCLAPFIYAALALPFYFLVG